ncbi:hypothetical protein [Gemmobacter sp.]|uniref:hypothetical protein n=1 Tax=Gemmobacter sp. TaxID=1898957 RepID=UPI002AFF6C8F|nr:hypothetical protein [Gemmobacter sp.]
MTDRVILRAFMAGLIDRAGGVDAAAAAIGARLGAEVSKGSISKRMSGQLDWPLVEIMALEDAVGDPCVRRWLARSLPEVGQAQSLMQGVAEAAREHGEAVAAVMELAAGKGCEGRARKEIADALVALKALAARMEAPE